jgi:uncharacterized protein (DUF488 family)
MAFTKAYSIGFTGKSAKQFFGILKLNNIAQLLDVRLNNVSQLAGFTKKNDLAFFLSEFGIGYIHEPMLAPNQEILQAYRNRTINWQEYEVRFLHLLQSRHIETKLSPALFAQPTVLLCSEAIANQCHRRLVLEYLQNAWQNLEIVHL